MNKNATLQLQPRKAKTVITIQHKLPLPPCCPVSKNPREGSLIAIIYRTSGDVLDVLYIPAYLQTFVNGKGDIRSAEDMIAQIADDVQLILGAPLIEVEVCAEIVLADNQVLTIQEIRQGLNKAV